MEIQNLQAPINQDDLDEELLNEQMLFARVKNFARDKFQDYVRPKNSCQDLAADAARYNALDLPDAYGEMFIPLDSAQCFWCSGIALMQKAESSLGLNSASTGSSEFQDIKAHYFKWTEKKNAREGQYYAVSVINMIERENNQNNYLECLLYASILGFDSRLFMPDKALLILEQARESLNSKETDQYLLDNFNYLIELYSGFMKLIQSVPAEAAERFDSAMQYRPGGINALFYKALAYGRAGERNEVIGLLEPIMEYDRSRFEHAISADSFPEFLMFMQNAVLYRFFSEKSFSNVFPELEILVNTSCQSQKSQLRQMYDWLGRLGEAELQDYYSESVIRKIGFLNRLISKYKESRHAMILMLWNSFETKFDQTIEEIRESITNSFLSIVKEKLDIYDLAIQTNRADRSKIEESFEQSKERLKKQKADALAAVENNINTQISLLEEKIGQVDSDRKFDPGSAFSSSMMYNAMISFMIFLIGGFIGGYLSGSPDDTPFRSMILTGIKFGGVSFVLGIFVCIFSAVSAGWERTAAKQKILKKIAQVKNRKESELAIAKAAAEKKSADLVKNYKDHLDDLDRAVMKIEEEKSIKSKEYNEDASKDKKKLIDVLDAVKS